MNALGGFLDSTLVALDPVERFKRCMGLVPDPWAVDFLTTRSEFVLLHASRQVGKSSAASIVIYDELVRGGFVLATAPTERQAKELGRKVTFALEHDASAPRLLKGTQTELEIAGGGRFVVLPATGSNIRGYSSASLLVFDEAGYLEDDTVTSLMPSRADSGRIVMCTTPGPRADCIFRQLWLKGDVHRVEARSEDLPRMRRRVEFDRKHMPGIKFRVEHQLEWLENVQAFISHDVIARMATTEHKAMVL